MKLLKTTIEVYMGLPNVTNTTVAPHEQGGITFNYIALVLVIAAVIMGMAYFVYGMVKACREDARIRRIPTNSNHNLLLGRKEERAEYGTSANENALNNV